LMEKYTWPGNVRELQNICERAVVLGRARQTGEIGREMIEPWLGMMGFEFEMTSAAGAADRAASGDSPAVRVRSEATSAFVESTNAQVERTLSPRDAQSEAQEESHGPARSSALADIVRPDLTLEELERDAIVRTLERFGGHRQKSAKSLGIGVRTLGLKLK